MLDRSDQIFHQSPPQRYESPAQRHESPSQRWESDEETVLDPAHRLLIPESTDYDTTIPSSLTSLQDEYGETFADEDLPAAEHFAQRKALEQEMAYEYGDMITTAVNTFHGRTRCPTCKQTPITTDYFEMNHSLPKGAWVQWKELQKKMAEQRPEILDPKDWTEFLGEMKTIENWYWEDNTASVECGRVSWNGNFAPHPVSTPEDHGELLVLSFPNPRRPHYGKVVPRFGKVI